MATSHKKVLVRRVAGDVIAGYLSLTGFLSHEAGGPVVELLDLSGRVLPMPLSTVKMVSYVRDFNLGDTANPERLGRRSFLARPRAEGLWLRLTFVTGDMLEGLAAADLSFLLHAAQDQGVHLTPPDVRSNTQRIFVPRPAIADLQVLAVITTPSRKKLTHPGESAILQDSLFSTLSTN